MKKILSTLAALAIVGFATTSFAAVDLGFEDDANLLQSPTFSGSTGGITVTDTNNANDTDANDRLNPADGAAGAKCYSTTMQWDDTVLGFVRITDFPDRHAFSEVLPGIGLYVKYDGTAGDMEINLGIREEPVNTGANEVYENTTWKLLSGADHWQYFYWDLATETDNDTSESWAISIALGDGVYDGAEVGSTPQYEGVFLRPIDGVTVAAAEYTLFLDDIHSGAEHTPLALPAGPGATPTVDGTVDAAYGSPIAVQTTQTQFGDATGALIGGGGSEMDALYVQNDGTNLYVMIAGNLEANGNAAVILIDDINASSGDTDTVLNDLPLAPGGVGERVIGGSGIGGSTMPASVDVDYVVAFKGFNNPYQYVYEYGDYAANQGYPAGASRPADLSTGATDNPAIGNDNTYLGLGQTFQFALDNSNSAGVAGGTAAADQVAAAAVTTGFEIAIPLALLGNVTENDELCIITAVANGNGDYWANQVLPGLATPRSNLEGDPSLITDPLAADCAPYTVKSGAAAAQSWTLFE